MRTLLLSICLCVIACLASAQPPRTLPADFPKSLTAISITDFYKFAQAADNVYVQAEARIAALKAELAAIHNVVAQGDTLTSYDQAKQRRLEAELSTAEAELSEARRVYNLIRDALPRRYRKRIEATPTFMMLYDCLSQYEADLKRRSGRLFVVGVAIGSVGTFLLLR
ncbi:hypothetical protein [Fibrella aquatica]|uniref:hypothetical protein n=1 Tax=Fibrella aquatica TaxID=3242487 RepID=UPI00351FD65C